MDFSLYTVRIHITIRCPNKIRLGNKAMEIDIHAVCKILWTGNDNPREIAMLLKHELINRGMWNKPSHKGVKAAERMGELQVYKNINLLARIKLWGKNERQFFWNFFLSTWINPDMKMRSFWRNRTCNVWLMLEVCIRILKKKLLRFFSRSSFFKIVS